MLRRFIIHPFTFAVFPILALLSYNITEVAPRIALRSLIISLAGMAVTLLAFVLITRNWQKAAITTTLTLVLFFSYGQTYEFLQAHPIFGANFGRHRYLVILYGIILIVGFWFIFYKSKKLTNASQVLNVLGVLLLIYPLARIIDHSVNSSISEQRLSAIIPKVDASVLTKPKNLPDIYFIILDGYTRGDALLKNLNYDDSAFLDELKSMGFYVAGCSRSNYERTYESLTSALNMDYLSKLYTELETQGFTNPADVWFLLKQSKTRYLLESMGYQTVAFDSGFEKTRFLDADIYLKYTGVPYELQVFQPFEAMLIRSTALLIWADSTYKSLPAYTTTIFTTSNFEFEDHINRQLFTLDELPHVPSIPGPKFVFAHILIPHPPYVFLPNGDIQTDPAFYSGNGFSAIDGEHQSTGYLNGIEYINHRIPDILHAIISESHVPPIIILMGDHGPSFADHNLILNAYYLSGKTEPSLYPSITPVNSFRLIFNTFFEANLNLLPDISYENGRVIPETYPHCIQN